jgi:hypothetical protein
MFDIGCVRNVRWIFYLRQLIRIYGPADKGRAVSKPALQISEQRIHSTFIKECADTPGYQYDGNKMAVKKLSPNCKSQHAFLLKKFSIQMEQGGIL